MSDLTLQSKPPKNPVHPIDARLTYINQKIIPIAPYILEARKTMNADYIRHHYGHTMSDWRKGTNFEPHEEMMQYMTFKDRSGDGDIRAMVARGGWDDGNGQIAPLEEPGSRSSSDFTPTVGPRKKITLAEYQNKTRDKAPSKHRLPEKNGVKVVEKDLDQSSATANEIKPVAAEKQPLADGQKRSADTMEGPGDPPSLIDQAHTFPPAKKFRTDPQESTIISKEPQKLIAKESAKIISEKSSKPVSQGFATKGNTVETKAEKREVPAQKHIADEGTTHNTTEPTSKPSKIAPPIAKSQKTVLPPMLSPLASDIEDEIAKLGPLVRKRSHSAVSAGASVSPMAKQVKTNPASTPSSGEKGKLKKAPASIISTPTKGPQKLQKVTSAPRQATDDHASKVTLTSKPTSKGLMNEIKEDIMRAVKPPVPEGGKKLRLRVTLKIRKKHRKTLSHYLMLKPTPGKYPPGLPRPEIAKTEVDPTSTTKTAGLVSSKTREKRRRSHDDDGLERPVRRPKAPSGISQKVHTPKGTITSSPALSQRASVHKAHLNAPELEPRSTPMVRGLSGESSIHTPAQPALINTPDNANRESVTSIKPTPLVSGPEDVRSEAKKYLDVARELKYDYDKFFKNPDGITDNQRRQGVVTGIESVLCWMLSFRLWDADRGYIDRTGWSSILGLLGRVEIEARRFGHLHGLARQLEGVIRDVLTHVDMKKLKESPLSRQFANAKSADPNRSEEQNRAVEYHRQFIEFSEHTDESRKAWHYGLMHLSPAEIAAKFPNTWAKREQHHPPVGKGMAENVHPWKYTRRYWLPLCQLSTALEAVNFGLDILKEYCQTNGVEWKPKLKL